MTALEERLRSLDPPTTPSLPLEELRSRVRRRRTRRRVLTGTFASLALVAVGAAFAAQTGGGGSGPVVAGPSGSMDGSTDPALRIFGGVSGVSLSASPATGLGDGDRITVRVDGAELLQDATFAVCRGDIRGSLDLAVCDVGAVQPYDEIPPVPVIAQQDLTVHSELVLLGGETYDCATEPAGCLIVAASTFTPVRGVGVPIEFASGAGRPETEEATTATTELDDNTLVAVSVSGLPPETALRIVQCLDSADGATSCNSPPGIEITTDDSGTLEGQYRVRTTVWTWGEGVTDCTTTQCALHLITDTGASAWSSPLGFAADAEVDLPSLSISPEGPYTDGQDVVVRGTGFPPGEKVGPHLGRCPADKDTRIEERCAYTDIFGRVVVDKDGTFAIRYTIRDGLMEGACSQGPGCVLGWVVSKGPTIAAVPLEISS